MTRIVCQECGKVANIKNYIKILPCGHALSLADWSPQSVYQAVEALLEDGMNLSQAIGAIHRKCLARFHKKQGDTPIIIKDWDD